MADEPVGRICDLPHSHKNNRTPQRKHPASIAGKKREEFAFRDSGYFWSNANGGHFLSFNDYHKLIFRQHCPVLSSMPRDLKRCLHHPCPPPIATSHVAQAAGVKLVIC